MEQYAQYARAPQAKIFTFSIRTGDFPLEIDFQNGYEGGSALRAGVMKGVRLPSFGHGRTRGVRPEGGPPSIFAIWGVRPDGADPP